MKKMAGALMLSVLARCDAKIGGVTRRCARANGPEPWGLHGVACGLEHGVAEAAAVGLASGSRER